MKRLSEKDPQWWVNRHNRAFGTHFRINRDYRRPRLEYADGSRSIGPRCTPKAFGAFMDAFYQGWDEATR